jgi:hypothetical protein
MVAPHPSNPSPLTGATPDVSGLGTLHGPESSTWIHAHPFDSVDMCCEMTCHRQCLSPQEEDNWAPCHALGTVSSRGPIYALSFDLQTSV